MNRIESFIFAKPRKTASTPAQTSVGTTAGVILAANDDRKGLIVVNTGTTVIYLGLGATPTTTAYHVALGACTSGDDGRGGQYFDDQWTGAVSAIGSDVGGTLAVTEIS